MKKTFKKLSSWIKLKITAVIPGKNAIKGAAFGLIILTGILFLLFSVISTSNIKDPWVLVLFLAVGVVTFSMAFVTEWVLRQVNLIPRFLKLSLLIIIPVSLLIFGDNILFLLAYMVVVSLTGASLFVMFKTGLKSLTNIKKIVTISGLVIGLGALVASIIFYIPSGFETDPFVNAALQSGPGFGQIEAPSPAEKGEYNVLTITYGSGKDRHRPEFGKEVNIKTDSVDGVAFIDDWKGLGGWWRTRYWGFDSRALPINARVWYPEGKGPFPLVLVVHGNHSMQDYSDPGYDYLGELLASRGFILASVDENFINGSWSDIFGGLDTENDARGWLLLEHLRVWHQWNESPDNIFYEKVDTSRIALIGHSRGGEAVGHAAMFNALPFYPDDASIKFDYNFNIRSIVAIAPVDGQYKPGNSQTKFENVSYFVLHGAQDADVSSFMGSQQFERVAFTDSLYHFKSALYIYGANHGQFNTTWGNNDTGHPFTGFLNLKQLLPASEQRQIAEVYISGFLETTLRDKYEYLPLFADFRAGNSWLPETTFLTQFQDSEISYICSFDEDFDVTTTTIPGGLINSRNLTVWKEQEIDLKWEKKGSRAVYLGWNYEEKIKEINDNAQKDDENTDPEGNENKEDPDISELLPDSLIASYSLEFSSGIQNIDSSSVFIFTLAESTEDSNPKSQGKWVSEDNENDKDSLKTDNDPEKEEKENGDDEKDEGDEEDEEDEPKEPLNFSIQLEDSTGLILQFPVSDFSLIQREIEVTIWKIDFVKKEKGSEKIFQLFYFPIRKLQKLNPDFDFFALKNIHFIFDQCESGVVVIDNIGFMQDLINISNLNKLSSSSIKH